jgi:WD40 repeat protein/serine/threonine protein kinase
MSISEFLLALMGSFPAKGRSVLQRRMDEKSIARENRMNEDSIFLDALQKQTPEERAAFLDQACANNAKLRQSVDLLLRAHHEAGPFLQNLRDDSATTDQPSREGPGTLIGPYKLLQQIGEGGMGTVFMAEQTKPVKRKVALKVIKPGMDSRQVIARFEAERQALAMMDHVNIARVLDAGTTGNPKSESRNPKQIPSTKSEISNRAEHGVSDIASSDLDIVSDFGFRDSDFGTGRPYFVMELVHGVPITKYCDDNQLTPRERLELFVPVCQAIQHAHQKGIIHRDIKPSNVMITLYDGKPVAKVIDFGVAKATEQKLTERSLFTQYGTMVGTLEYMSPEQAEMSALGVDTRSDIYSLGVLLYELLTGTTPLSHKQVREAAYGEILRMIKEEEPPKPSTRLSDSGAALASISAQRHMQPAELTKLVRGELDWIVMKCLEKDRNRRYETASAIAADVQRYLRDEPVQACPPSAAYRVRKFARRNKVALVMAAVVAAALLIGTAVSAWQAVEAHRARRDADGRLESEEQALENEKQARAREQQSLYFHRIALAHQELLADNLGRALKLLDECPDDLRDWEWYYLRRLCRVEPVVLSNETDVHSIAFRPDGKQIAAACGDGTVRVYDVPTRKVIRTLHNAHKPYAFSVAFRPPDGRYLASAGADRKVRLWDLTTGQQVFEGDGQAGELTGVAYSVAFSPDGHHLVAGSEYEGAIVWDTADGHVVLRLPEHKKEKAAESVAFSPDGTLIASGSWGGVLRIWDARTGQLLHERQGHGQRRISAVAFHPDGRWLATAGFDRTVQVWDTTTGNLLRTLRGHNGLVSGLTFSRDGRRLASSGGEDKTVKVWDPLTGREVLNLRDHTFMCHCVTCSPDGRWLASASSDGTIRIWDATPLTGNEGLGPRTCGHDDEIWSVAFSPDGLRLASASWDKTVRLWDARTGAPLRTLHHPGIGLNVAFHPDSRQLASAANTPERIPIVIVWDAETGQEVRRTRANSSTLVTFDPKGRYLLTEGPGHAVQVLDPRNDKVLGVLGRHDELIWGMTFSPDGKRLATASNDWTVKVWAWDPARLGQGQEPELTLPVRALGWRNRVAFSPDGLRLVTGGSEHTVKIWDAKTGQELQTLRGHTGDVFALAFSPDRRWLASAGEDTTIRLWDAKTGEPRYKLRGHTGWVNCLAFSPDSQRLASGSRDHTLKVWDLSLLEAKR